MKNKKAAALTLGLILGAMSLVPAYAGVNNSNGGKAAEIQQSSAGGNIDQVLLEGDAVHNYYLNVSDEGRAEADAICRGIAEAILADGQYKTDEEKVSAAARVVSEQCLKITYGQDGNKYYRSPYGVFVSGNYTCAGATRALGRILEFMGYSWEHVGENEEEHQWCVLTMDGKKGWADGQGGIVGFGSHDQFGLVYEFNTEGNYTASDASNAEKIADVRKNGGDLFFYYYVPYVWSKVPASALASYNVDDVDPQYNFRYTFRPDNTMIMHSHPEKEACHAEGYCESNKKDLHGDLVCTYAGEGTEGGVHYVDYQRTQITKTEPCMIRDHEDVLHTVVTARLYDSGILCETYAGTYESDGKKTTTRVTTALR